jgi:hypothetical protein
VHSSVRRDTRCECGAKYGDMRTGLTFSSVAQMMKTHDPETYRQIRRRRQILGFWRELKLMQWNMEHESCHLSFNIQTVSIYSDTAEGVSGLAADSLRVLMKPARGHTPTTPKTRRSRRVKAETQKSTLLRESTL